MIVELLNSITIYLRLDFIMIKVDFFSKNLVIDFMYAVQVMCLKIDSKEVDVLVLFVRKEHFIFQLVCITAQQSVTNYS